MYSTHLILLVLHSNLYLGIKKAYVDYITHMATYRISSLDLEVTWVSFLQSLVHRKKY